MTSLCLEPCEVMWHPTSPLSWPTFLPCFHDRLCKYNVHRAEKLCSLFTRMIPTARLKPGTHRIAAISTCKMNGGQPRNPVFYTVKLDPNMIWLSSALVRFWLRTDPKYKKVLTDPGLSLLLMYLSYNEKKPADPITKLSYLNRQLHYQSRLYIIFKKYIQFMNMKGRVW